MKQKKGKKVNPESFLDVKELTALENETLKGGDKKDDLFGGKKQRQMN